MQEERVKILRKKEKESSTQKRDEWKKKPVNTSNEFQTIPTLVDARIVEMVASKKSWEEMENDLEERMRKEFLLKGETPELLMELRFL
jgi:hypothetical protein